LVRAELLAREPATEDLRSFVGWLLSADGVVVSGRGGTTDVFLEDGIEVLRLLRTAIGIGTPTAMFGQGLGPLEDERLRALAREVLPQVDVLAIREGRSAMPLLAGLGVRPDRVTVSGDDALELAHRLRSNGAARTAIGVGLRIAPYSGVTGAAAETLRAVVRGAAARHGSELRPVPISLYPHEAEARMLAELLDRPSRTVPTPAYAIAQAGSCRIVVAGSYHAAVFALAQGVPVVGVSASPYYEAKLGGLAELFPGGCRVVSALHADFGARLAAAVDEAWEAAETLSPELVAAAERQITAAGDAYARFAERVSRHAGTSAALSRAPG
jgi:colanic acid/amylovoran biosynthesis protein